MHGVAGSANSPSNFDHLHFSLRRPEAPYAAGLVNSILCTPPDFMPALCYVSVLERIQPTSEHLRFFRAMQPSTEARLHCHLGRVRNLEKGKREDNK